MLLARAVDRSLHSAMLIGLGFLYGTGIVCFVELAMPRWSAVTVTSALLLVAALCGLRIWRQRASSPAPRTALAPHLFDLLTVLVVVSYVLMVTAAPLPEWDFGAVWGLKGKVFFEHHGIDWHFLKSRWNRFSHPDYPLLLPLNYDYLALLRGGWDDSRLGVLSAAFGVATLLIVRAATARQTSPMKSALITLACAPVALAIQPGIGESPMIAFTAAALLLLRDDDCHPPILLGLAGCSKNEGIALIAVVLAALLLFQRRRVLRFWPALAIAAPWMAVKTILSLKTDLAEGSFIARAAERAPAAGEIAMALLQSLADRWVWLAIVLAFAVATAAARRRQRLIIAIVLLQLAAYFAIYLGVPYRVDWYIEGSWSRLTRQILIPALVAAMLALAQTMAPEEDGAHAET